MPSIPQSLAALCLLAVCSSSLRLTAQEAAPPAPPPPLNDAGTGDPALDRKIQEEVARQLAEIESKRWTAGLNPKGGGAFIKSPDGKTYFRLYGYAQPTFTYTDKDNALAFEQTDFRVRRARVDFTVDYDERFKLFVELDGAPADGTALVEAWTQAAYVKDRHYLRVGKFITPFSTENLRSSRALDTVERYLALNTMFGLPALDVQFGPMLWGYADAGKKLTYYVGVWNGNASAGAAVASGQRGNARDNNGAKEVQGRVNYQWTKELVTGAAVDFDQEEPQTLQLANYAGGRFLALPVDGKRQGIDLDLHWKRGNLSVDSEWLRSDFKDSGVVLDGGYGQVACWVRGSEADGGVQPVLRVEYARLDGDPVRALDGDTLEAVTLGANVWWNGATRWQVNLIGEHFDGRGNGSFRAGAGWRPTILNQFQIKF